MYVMVLTQKEIIRNKQQVDVLPFTIVKGILNSKNIIRVLHINIVKLV